MEIEIRIMRRNDLGQIGSFLPEMWFSHSSHSNLVSKQKISKLNPHNYLKELLQDKNRGGFVAVINKKIIGFIGCEIKDCPDFYSFKKELYVDDLVVSENFRRQGIAIKLISECVSFAKNQNVDLLTCKIWKFNKKSRLLFKKLGFNEDFSYFSYNIKKD